MHPRYEGFLIVSLHVSVMHKYELGCGLVSTERAPRDDNSVLIIIHMDVLCYWLRVFSIASVYLLYTYIVYIHTRYAFLSKREIKHYIRSNLFLLSQLT